MLMNFCVRSRKIKYTCRRNDSLQKIQKKEEQEKTVLRNTTYMVAPHVCLAWKAHWRRQMRITAKLTVQPARQPAARRIFTEISSEIQRFCRKMLADTENLKKYFFTEVRIKLE